MIVVFVITAVLKKFRDQRGRGAQMAVFVERGPQMIMGRPSDLGIIALGRRLTLAPFARSPRE